MKCDSNSNNNVAVAITLSGTRQTCKKPFYFKELTAPKISSKVAKNRNATLAGDDQNLLEQRLLKELADIKRRQADLLQEQNSVERMLLRVRREGVAAKVVARRDSVPRLLIEREMLDALSASKEKTLSTRSLIRHAQTVDRNVKDATVRSYLHRLKARGLILPAGHGLWRLPQPIKEAGS